MSGPRIIVISGPGGSGKNTLLDMLLSQLPNAVRVITATTYAPRPGEQEGIDHYFLSKPEFAKRVQKGEFVEFARTRGALFGTLKQPLDDELRLGKTVMMELTVDGGLAIKKAYPRQTTLIFINAESLEALENRMRDRGIDSEEGIKERLKEAEREIAIGKKDYDYYLVNQTGHPEVALEEIKTIIDGS